LSESLAYVCFLVLFLRVCGFVDDLNPVLGIIIPSELNSVKNIERQPHVSCWGSTIPEGSLYKPFWVKDIGYP